MWLTHIIELKPIICGQHIDSVHYLALLSKMSALISNVPNSASTVDPNFITPVDLIVGCKKLWVALLNMGTVNSYNFDGCLCKTYTVPGVTAVAEYDKESIVASSVNGLSLLCKDECCKKVSIAGDFGDVTTTKKHIYVINSTTNEVWVYDKCSWEPVMIYSDKGLSDFDYAPIALTSQGGRVYVLYGNIGSSINDTGAGYVNVIEKKCVKRLINRGPFSAPTDITAEGDRLYIANNLSGTIAVYTLEGVYLHDMRTREGGTIVLGGINAIAFHERKSYAVLSCDGSTIGILTHVE